MENNMNETVGDIFSIFEDFTYDGVTLNIVKILDDIWFRAKDITAALGYKNTEHAVKRHVKDKYKRTLENLTPPETGGEVDRPYRKDTTYMNEYGVLQLVMKSKLPSAETFQDWIIEEVIPSIRRTGQYQNQELINRVQKLELENQTLTVENQAQHDMIQEKAAENKEQYDTINKKDETINNKSEVVVPPTTNPRHNTYFLLVEMSKDYEYIEGDPDHYKESQYITIRCQKRSIASLLARVQKAGNESNSTARVVCMSLNPNAINYALRLKKEYGNLIKCKYNGITTSLPESELKEIIYKVNGEKYQYGVKS
jgi:prophage antirepressor-like protein